MSVFLLLAKFKFRTRYFMHDRNKKVVYVILILVFLIGAVAVSFVSLPNTNYFVLDPYLSLPAAASGEEFNVSFNVFPTPTSSPPSTLTSSHP